MLDSAWGALVAACMANFYDLVGIFLMGVVIGFVVACGITLKMGEK